MLTKTFTNTHGRTEEIPSSLFKSDQRDLACQGTLIQGNLPLEIANYLTNFAEHIQAEGRLSIPLYNAMMAGTGQLVEVLTNCERILRTPIPLAYNIAISQTGMPYLVSINVSMGICASSPVSIMSIVSMGYDSCVHGQCVYPFRATAYFVSD
jgi:predicted membrane chloride channel (bestrophin family)